MCDILSYYCVSRQHRRADTNTAGGVRARLSSPAAPRRRALRIDSVKAMAGSFGRVICCGCACLDLFLLNSEVLPTRESLALVQSTSFTPGCSTSNTGRALAELGVPVEILTQIGEDVNGDTLIKMWSEFGIGTKLVRRTKDASTSLSGVIFSTASCSILNLKRFA